MIATEAAVADAPKTGGSGDGARDMGGIDV